MEHHDMLLKDQLETAHTHVRALTHMTNKFNVILQSILA